MKTKEILKELSNNKIFIERHWNEGDKRYRCYRLMDSSGEKTAVYMHGLTRRYLYRETTRIKQTVNGKEIPLNEPFCLPEGDNIIEWFYALKKSKEVVKQ